MNFTSYNSILPSNSNPTFSGVTNTKADPVMYSFMVNQLAQAIRRANNDMRPGAIGWGQTLLLGITQNRSLGAHLANYGLNEGANGGTVSQDPGGYINTIDPTVNVLRIDQYRPGPGGGSRAIADRAAREAHPPGHPADAGRHLLDLRQPRHRRPRELPVLQR